MSVTYSWPPPSRVKYYFFFEEKELSLKRVLIISSSRKPAYLCKVSSLIYGGKNRWRAPEDVVWRNLEESLALKTSFYCKALQEAAKEKYYKLIMNNLDNWILQPLQELIDIDLSQIVRD